MFSSIPSGRYKFTVTSRAQTPVSELLAATEKPVAPATTKSKGKRVFFTGHSFFIAGGYMAKKVDLIAKAAGKEKHELVG